MPQIDQSSKLGHSPSPTIEMVKENNANVQKVLPVGSATKAAYNKETVKVPISKK
jgi:hypothetical protein